MWKLVNPITLEDVIEESYEDYCNELFEEDEEENTLDKNEWIKTDEAKQSITMYKNLLGMA
jgi:hypothetical protein